MDDIKAQQQRRIPRFEQMNKKDDTVATVQPFGSKQNI
jgi:hypothetical protein